MNIGKKILSAFVEVADEKTPVASTAATVAPAPQAERRPAEAHNKFRQHFAQLFADANLPGPDYYEYAKMVEAMHIIADERARYMAAFAGLGVQGLNKEKLLSSATDYLKIVETDAAAFAQTLEAALHEKVHSRKQEMADKKEKIQQLSQEVAALHSRNAELQTEIRENEEKILNRGEGYKAAAENIKAKIMLDIEKIQQHVG